MRSNTVRFKGGGRIAAALVGAVLLFVAVVPVAGAVTDDGRVGAPLVFGTLQSSPDRVDRVAAAGVDLVTMEVYWDRFEPRPGQANQAYLDQLRVDLARYRAADVEVVLAPGVHYPPAWVLDLPDSRYVNQYDDQYRSTEPGKNVPNMVFNQAMRDRQATFLQQVIGALGKDFYGVRLGGGWYGELNYPSPEHGGRTNSYWGFDPVATGQRPGRPPGIPANPVPDWRPGVPSTNHADAAEFLDWYLDSLGDYHDWQIQTMRDLYPGRLLMLYPSWGVRPGQLDAAVAGDLSGTTSAERNGEIQRGFDFARFVTGITDPGVVLYTTWLNADASADDGSDPRYWSPVKFLAHLAADHPVPLQVMGENTGHDTVQDLELSIAQAREHGLLGVVWAFEPQLFEGPWARLDDLAKAIRTDRTPVTPPVPPPSVPTPPAPAPAPTVPAPTSTPTSGPADPTDVVHHDFNQGTSGWQGEGPTSVAHDTSTAGSGLGSLRLTRTVSGSWDALRAGDSHGALRDISRHGDTVSVWVLVPEGTPGTWRARVEVQDEQWRYQGGPTAMLTPGNWQRVQATVSTELGQKARAFGVQLEVVGGHGEVTAHVDTFTQGHSAAPTTPTPTPPSVDPLKVSTTAWTDPSARRTWSTTRSARGGTEPYTSR